MKGYFCLAIFIIISLSCFSQGINNQAITVKNELTSDYSEVTGTQISLLLPSGFVASDRFVRFEHKIAGTSIVITEVPGEVRKNFLAFGRVNLIQRGLLIEKEELYLINGFDALLQYGQQSAYGKMYRRWLLVIGDNQKTFLLNASAPAETSMDHAEAIKKCLLSVVYQPAKKASSSERYDFTLDFKESGLKQVSILINSMIYTDDGILPPKTEAKVVMMASRTKPAVPIKDKKVFASSLLDMLPVKWPNNEKPEPITIELEGLSGYEVYGLAVNKDNNRPQLVYELVLYNGDYYYLVSGLAFKYFEDNLDLFKSVARTFKLK